MAYTKTIWVNNSSPAISAANLNKIENGIASNDSAIGDISQLETTATDLTSAVNENKETIDTLSTNLSPTVLYSNATGVNTPVPLSDSLSNYTYIEVYTIDGFGSYTNYSCTRAMVSVGNSITIQNAVANADSQVIWEVTRYTMNNTALTRVYGLSPRISTSGASLVQNSDRTKVVKVLGYK